MANHDKMPSGFKITNKAGLILHDSSWIAGVDYDHDNYNKDEELAYNNMHPNDIAENMQPNQLEAACHAPSNQEEIIEEVEMNDIDDKLMSNKSSD
jgi:uncharacterized membrane-anchored protein